MTAARTTTHAGSGLAAKPLGAPGRSPLRCTPLFKRAQALAWRMPQLGVGPDLAALDATDLDGVCRFMEREAGSKE